MENSIRKDVLVLDQPYWYVFESEHVTQIQLLMVKFDTDEDSFYVYEYEYGDNTELYKTFPIDITLVDEYYLDLFDFEDKHNAELQVVFKAIKSFDKLVGFDFETFIKRYKELFTLYPELLLKV